MSIKPTIQRAFFDIYNILFIESTKKLWHFFNHYVQIKKLQKVIAL